MRIGHGYDVHRTCAGRTLILGGVQIKCKFGLLGHSDADVLAHAIIDALLGAAGLGDIGEMFPDTCAKYAEADSIDLLREVGVRLRTQGWRVENIDSTIVAEAPKLSPHKPQMRTNLADALGICPSQVSVKATTEEGLGFTGTGDGIAAHAICLITRSVT